MILFTIILSKKEFSFLIFNDKFFLMNYSHNNCLFYFIYLLSEFRSLNIIIETEQILQ